MYFTQNAQKDRKREQKCDGYFICTLVGQVMTKIQTRQWKTGQPTRLPFSIAHHDVGE